MIFESVAIDVLEQNSIEDARAKMPGGGVGTAVARALTMMVRESIVTTASQLLRDYVYLGRLFRLPA